MKKEGVHFGHNNYFHYWSGVDSDHEEDNHSGDARVLETEESNIQRDRHRLGIFSWVALGRQWVLILDQAVSQGWGYVVEHG